MTVAEMTFTEHLGELRTRLVRAAVAVLVGFFVAYNWHIELFDLVAGPLKDALASHGVYKLQALQVTETIIVYMKVSIVAGLIGVGPFVLYQVWAFVAPGLLPKEQRWVIPIVAFSSVFFVIGVAFAYEVMLPFVTGFLVEMTQEGGQVEMMLTISNAFSFSLVTMLLFGFIFELPLAIFFLSILGLVTHKGLLKFFRYFVVVAFIGGAILTPPDPISQTLLAVPVIGLYGLGILIAFLVGRRRTATGELKPIVGSRLIVTVVVAMALVGGIIFFALELLKPSLHATDLVPRDATFVAGLTPANLSDVADDALGGAAQAVASGSADTAKAVRDVISQGGVGTVVVIGDEEGHRAIIVDGGASGGTVPAGLEDGEGTTGAVIDEDVLVFGSRELVQAVVRCRSDEESCMAADSGHKGRLTELRQAGPAWLYAPEASEGWRALFPYGSEVETARTVSAVLSVGDGPVTVWSLELESEAAARAFRSRVLSWRDQRNRDAAQEERSARQDVELRDLERKTSALAKATREALGALAATRPPEGEDPAAFAVRRETLLAKLDGLARELEHAAPDAQGIAGHPLDEQENLIERLPKSDLRDWDVTTEGAAVELRLRLSQRGLLALLSGA